MIDIEVVKPITIYWIDGSVTIASHNGFETDPSSDDALRFRIEGSSLTHNHRRKNGLCALLYIVHPAPVTVCAHTFCDEVDGLVALPCMFVRTGMQNHSVLGGESARALHQESRHPLREDMLPGSWSLAAEDASSGQLWCPLDDGREEDAEDPEGTRNPHPTARGVPSRPQEGGEGQPLNPAPPPLPPLPSNAYSSTVVKHLDSGFPAQWGGTIKEKRPSPDTARPQNTGFVANTINRASPAAPAAPPPAPRWAPAPAPCCPARRAGDRRALPPAAAGPAPGAPKR